MGQKQQTAASPGGLEPPTFRLTAERANRLRHGDLCEIKYYELFLKKFRSLSFCDVILTGSILFYLNKRNKKQQQQQQQQQTNWPTDHRRPRGTVINYKIYYI